MNFKLDLIETFVAVGGAQLREIEQALALDDMGSISRTAHKLKANSGALFASEVSRCATRLETEAKHVEGNGAGRDVSLAALVQELRGEFSRAIDFLRSSSA